MPVTEVVALVGAAMLIITTVTGSLISLLNVRANRERIDRLQTALDEAEHRSSDNRRDIILIGESLAAARSDNAKLALLINQLFRQFEQATGERPAVDLEMLKNMQTLSYITGPLGPLDVSLVSNR